MFCSNCGSRLLEGSVRCGICGMAQANQQPLQPETGYPTAPKYGTVPSYNPNPAYPPEATYNPLPSYNPPQMPQYDLGPTIPEDFVDRDRVRKGKFLRSHADSTTKVLGIVAWVLAIAFAVVLFLAGSATINGSVFAIPAVRTLLELEGIDAVYELEELRFDALTELQFILHHEDLSNSEERLVEDAMELLQKDLSIGSILNAVAVAADYSDNSLSGVDGISNQAVLGLIAFIINFGYILAGLFLLIGILCYAGGWIWAAMILAVLQALSLSGPLPTALIAVLGIALIVILGRINKAYRSFKTGC